MYVSCATESDKKVFNKKLSCAEVCIYGSMNVVVKDSFTTNNFQLTILKTKTTNRGGLMALVLLFYCKRIKSVGGECETLGVR